MGGVVTFRWRMSKGGRQSEVIILVLDYSNRSSELSMWRQKKKECLDFSKKKKKNKQKNKSQYKNTAITSSLFL